MKHKNLLLLTTLLLTQTTPVLAMWYDETPISETPILYSRSSGYPRNYLADVRDNDPRLRDPHPLVRGFACRRDQDHNRYYDGSLTNLQGNDINEIINRLVNRVECLTLECLNLQDELRSSQSLRLAAKFNPFSVHLSYQDNFNEWRTCTTTNWVPLPFNTCTSFNTSIFEEVRNNQGNCSYLTIPEDGQYHVSGTYHWRAQGGDMLAYTGIAFNESQPILLKSHHLPENFGDLDTRGGVFNLRSGTRVSLVLQGHSNAEYHPSTFRLNIEKIMSR